jgi:hypothetical protein
VYRKLLFGLKIIYTGVSQIAVYGGDFFGVIDSLKIIYTRVSQFMEEVFCLSDTCLNPVDVT